MKIKKSLRQLLQQLLHGHIYHFIHLQLNFKEHHFQQMLKKMLIIMVGLNWIWVWIMMLLQ